MKKRFVFLGKPAGGAGPWLAVVTPEGQWALWAVGSGQWALWKYISFV